MASRTAALLTALIGIICGERKAVDFDYAGLMARIHRAKEREKDIITTYLKDMTDEEREIENLMKNNRLGRWSKGLDKGIRTYQASTYDQEREEMEAQALAEMRLGDEHLVTSMNRELYAMDDLAEQAEADRIEAEEMSLSHLPDDDDYGDRDGDEGY